MFLYFLALLPFASYAFAPQPHFAAVLRQQEGKFETSSSLHASRRDFVEATLGTAVLLTVPTQNAWASGGATAGGAYLLSAKQRYNERVLAGVKGFLGLQSALEAGNIDALRVYFTNEDTGSWKDLTAAGYLLANAFRRNSTAAPDSLPSVKVSQTK